MPSTPSLIQKLVNDFPSLHFVESDAFQWSSDTKTVSYNATAETTPEHILHELAHALLDHHAYTRDIELLKMEREAWTYARDELTPKYGVMIDDDTREEALNSYREWLHARSTCPECTATGIETAKHLYRCPACRHTWRVNEARLCGLKRYSIQK